MNKIEPQRPRLFLSPPHQTGREAELIAEALRSNYVAPVGPMLDAFERELAACVGVEHCVAVASGTAALHLALRILGIGPGDRVWAPSLTFMGGISPIAFQGATPVFFDSDERCLIDLDLVEAELPRAAARGEAPKALIVTDLYGIPVDMARARKLCERFGVTLIADAAESLGSRLAGIAAGKGADFIILSFNGNKIITTSGGGALLAPRKDWIDRARHLSTQAREPVPYYEHVEIGYNYRLSNICAAIGRAQLEALAARVARKREIYAAYRDGLQGLPGVSFLEEPPGAVSNRWLAVIFIDPAASGVTPEQTRLALESRNIESRPVWKPMHLQPVFAGAASVGGKVSERLFAHGLCLPSGTAMSDAEQAQVIEIIAARIGNGGAGAA